MTGARPAGLLLLGLAAACGRGLPEPPTRPVAVAGSAFPQHDVTVDGLRLRYVDVGPTDSAAQPLPLVIIPGHTSRLEGYDPLVRLLSPRHRVLVLDFPGSGYSEKPDREYTLRFYEDVLLGFLDAVGVERAILVGGSLGGNLVLRLGHRVPERFPRLVAWAPGGAWRAQPRLAAVMEALGGRLLFWPVVWIQSRFWYADDFPGKEEALSGTFAYYREVMSPGFVRMYWGMAVDQVRQSLFGIAPQVRQPVLLMWGDQDHGADMGAGVAKLHRLLPRNELRIFPGARHSIETEIPDAVGATIDGFVSRPEELLP